jgi:hypothetical protein
MALNMLTRLDPSKPGAEKTSTTGGITDYLLHILNATRAVIFRANSALNGCEAIA